MTSKVTLHPANGMSAIATAEQLHREHYRDEPGAPAFIEMLALYLKHAFVITTPELFVMFRPVNTKGRPEQIVDPRARFKKPNAWFVYSAVSRDAKSGGLRKLPQLMPYALPRIAFYRHKNRQRMRVYATLNLFRRIYGRKH